jgi:hypothetical protein
MTIPWIEPLQSSVSIESLADLCEAFFNDRFAQNLAVMSEDFGIFCNDFCVATYWTSEWQGNNVFQIDFNNRNEE